MFRLEKLEIIGFKSFADRAALVFGEGITGVVGPNGCGKSNIAEAISWVLGEQSAKNLRGGKMEDVIFNGSRDRKPVGMAEVLLTLVAIEDIAEREYESKDDEIEYDEVVEIADRAAEAARLLVQESSTAESNPQTTEAAEGQSAAGEAGEASEASDRSEAAAASRPVQIAARSAHRRRKRKSVAISAGERITVGRRLYRTGDSEYLMNGRACLLRDIQDLFAGTGLGGSHYAIIEQGRIGQILSSKPLDRRALIEEAAGITKFKSRKRAAELKLESAKQNLTRLNDIISEVERQVNSLKRQAQKARRYRRLREEMRGLQKFVFTSDYYRLSEAAERAAENLAAAERKLQEIDAQLAERESEHRVVSHEARSSEDALAALRERAAAVELEADRARNRRAFEEQQMAELTAHIEELERDQRALAERLTLLEAEAERRLADLKALEAELAREQAELLEREEGYQRELSALRQAEGEIEQLRQRMLTEIGATERLRNLSASMEEGLRRLDLKQASLHAELERATLREQEAADEHARVGGEAEGNRARLLDLANSISDRAAALQSMRSDALELRSQLEAVHAERASAEHRLASLEDLDAHHAYYSDAVQQVLSPEQAQRINAIGTLADFVEVEPQYERLVESLFGRELQCVLVPTIDDALAGVEYIKSEGLGRGAFLVVGLHGGEGEPYDFMLEANTNADAQAGQTSPDRAEPNALPDADDAGQAAGATLTTALMRLDDNVSLLDSIAAHLGFGGSEEEADHDIASEAIVDNGDDEAMVVDEVMIAGTDSRVERDTVERDTVDAEESRRAGFDQEDAAQAMRFQLDVLRAIDLLGLKPAVKIVAERAFPDKCAAAVVPDIEAALQLSIENASRVYVTYEGEQVVNGRLIVTAGQAGQKGTSLLGLKREIKQLRVQTQVLCADEARLAAELEQAQAQLEQVEIDVASLDRELRQQEKTAAARDSQLEGLARDLERARQHVRVVEAELGQTAEERAELEIRIAELSGELGLAESSRLALEQSLSAAQSQFVEMRASLEQSSEQLSSARASVAARVERLQAARSETRRIENEAGELESRINRNRLELYESHNRIEQLSASQVEGGSAAMRFEAERGSLDARISEVAASLAASRARADELEAALTQLRQSAAAAHDARSQVQIESARIESEAEHLMRTCFSELAMSLEDVVTSFELGRAANQMAEEVPAQIIDGAQANAASAEGAQAAASDTEQQAPTASGQMPTDVESARARLDELRVKLDEMGPVNMMALEELEEAEERFRFLSEQRRDILDSIRMTEEALAEIKRRSRERFRHAFAHINQNFQHTFVELFGGGRGEMMLIDEEDVLESGIDLIAQPPGKRLQNVLLLSGGEKAMAAIALVLAIFQYKPSPFCILDEVDAPLDEMNVGRFSAKVEEMSRGTQFLVITHNKRTMEVARVLYGVTMEEPGISKLVSVKFQ
jgi:chromosome segregation protein